MDNPSSDLGLLIEVIQNYPFIYDMSHGDYKNKKMKEQAWNEISGVVGIPVDDCIRHWKNLRDRYLREKRQKPSGPGAPESTWRYFEKMFFYAKYSKPRRAFTTTIKSSSGQESRPGSSCSSSSAWSAVQAILSPAPADDCEESIINLKQEDNSKTTADTVREKKPKIMRKEKTELHEVVEVAKIIAQSFEDRGRHNYNVNKTFTDYMYSRLQQMSAEEAKEKRKKLFLLLES